MSKEEILKLQEEYQSLKEKLKELSEEELKEVVGGIDRPFIGLRDEGKEFLKSSLRNEGNGGFDPTDALKKRNDDLKDEFGGNKSPLKLK